MPNRYKDAADNARAPDGSLSASRFIANCDAADAAPRLNSYDVTAWRPHVMYSTLTVQAATAAQAIEIARPQFDDADDWEYCDEGGDVDYIEALPNMDENAEELDGPEHTADWMGLDKRAAALRAMLEKLIEWDAHMGNHESEVWAEARKLYEDTRV